MTDPVIADMIAGVDAGIERARTLRRVNSDAEAEHYRLMHKAGRMVEGWDAVVDRKLEERYDLQHAMDPIDPSDPATVAAIADAWDGFMPEPVSYDQRTARLAVELLAAMVPVVGGIQELPALIQCACGCGAWVTDHDDPVAAQYPEVALGCPRAW